MSKDINLVPEIQIEIAGADELAAELRALGKSVTDKTYVVTRHFGAVLQSDVRARARSLFEVTDYDSHIGLRMSSHRGRSMAEVGTDDPQGFRLELGFVGVDSLGRHYEQPPRPHFGPALDQIGPAYVDAIRGLLDR